MSARLTSILILAIGLAGCTDNAPTDVSSAPAASTQSPAAAPGASTQQQGSPTVPIQAAASPMSATPTPAPGATGPAPGAQVPPIQGPNGQRMDLGNLQRALAAATQASAQAGGDTNCERGYNNLVAMVRELRTRVGNSGQRNPPEHDAFVEACNELPPEVQECLVLSYALAHRADCEVRKNSLDPTVRARIRALMSGGAPEPAAP